MTGLTLASVRRAALVSAVAIAGFGTAGCGDTNAPGTAVPATTTTGTSASDTKPTSTTATSSTKAESLADTDPCELLTADDKSALGVTKSEGPEKFGTARICRFRAAAGGITPSIWDAAGLAQAVETGPVSDVTVGSREAKQMRNTATGGCVVMLAVAESSRVDVLATDRQGDRDEACDLALQAAKLIEPNLPKS